MVGKRSVAHTAKRLRHNPTIRRPKRNIPVKSIDDTVGLSKKEEKELKKALYASLQETKLKVTYAYETVVDGKVVSTSRHEPPPPVPAFEEPSPRIYVSSTAPSIDESSQDSVKSYNSSYTNTTSISEPIRTKVHAQRKFAQGSLPVTPSTTPVKSVTSPFKLLPKTAKTEDFLTFLCLRGTSVLPPHLDFLNFSREESGDSHSTSRPDTPAGSNSSKNTKAGEVTRESTPESSSVSSNDELQQLRTPSPSTRNSGINSALRKAARASAGTPETARGIVSLRQGLTRKVSSLAHTPSPQRTRRSLCTPDKTPTSRGSQTRKGSSTVSSSRRAGVKSLSNSFSKYSPTGKLAIKRKALLASKLAAGTKKNLREGFIEGSFNDTKRKTKFCNQVTTRELSIHLVRIDAHTFTNEKKMKPEHVQTDRETSMSALSNQSCETFSTSPRSSNESKQTNDLNVDLYGWKVFTPFVSTLKKSEICSSLSRTSYSENSFYINDRHLDSNKGFSNFHSAQNVDRLCSGSINCDQDEVMKSEIISNNYQIRPKILDSAQNIDRLFSGSIIYDEDDVNTENMSDNYQIRTEIPLSENLIIDDPIWTFDDSTDIDSATNLASCFLVNDPADYLNIENIDSGYVNETDFKLNYWNDDNVDTDDNATESFYDLNTVNFKDTENDPIDPPILELEVPFVDNTEFEFDAPPGLLPYTCDFDERIIDIDSLESPVSNKDHRMYHGNCLKQIDTNSSLKTEPDKQRYVEADTVTMNEVNVVTHATVNQKTDVKTNIQKNDDLTAIKKAVHNESAAIQVPDDDEEAVMQETDDEKRVTHSTNAVRIMQAAHDVKTIIQHTGDVKATTKAEHDEEAGMQQTDDETVANQSKGAAMQTSDAVKTNIQQNDDVKATSKAVLDEDAEMKRTDDNDEEITDDNHEEANMQRRDDDEVATMERIDDDEVVTMQKRTDDEKAVAQVAIAAKQTNSVHTIKQITDDGEKAVTQSIDDYEQAIQIPDDYEQAIRIPDDYEQAIRIPDDDGQAIQILDDYEQAIQIPDDDEQAVSIPDDYEQAIQIPEDYEQAIQIPDDYEQATQIPDNDEQAVQISDDYEQAIQIPDDYKQAIQFPDDYEHAIRIPDDDGQAIQIPDDYEQAIQIPDDDEQAVPIPDDNEQTIQIPEDYEQAIQIPEDYEQAMQMIDEHGVQISDDYEQAKQISDDYEQAIQISDDYEQAIPIPDDYERAIQIPENYERAIRIPDDVEQAVQIPDDYEQAIQIPNDYEQAIQIPDDDEQAVQIPDDYEQAIQIPNDYEQAIQIPDDDEQAVQIPGDYEQAIQISDDYEQAIRIPEDYEHIIQIPDDDEQAIQIPYDNEQVRPAQNLTEDNVKEVTQIEDDVKKFELLSHDVMEAKQIAHDVIEAEQIQDDVREAEQLPVNVIEAEQLLDDIIVAEQILDGDIVAEQILVGVIDAEQLSDDIIEAKQLPDDVMEARSIPGNVMEAGPFPDGVEEAEQLLDDFKEAEQLPSDVKEAAQIPDEVLEAKQLPDYFMEAEQLTVSVKKTEQLPHDFKEAERLPHDFMEAEQLPHDVKEPKQILHDVNTKVVNHIIEDNDMDVSLVKDYMYDQENEDTNASISQDISIPDYFPYKEKSKTSFCKIANCETQHEDMDSPEESDSENIIKPNITSDICPLIAQADFTPLPAPPLSVLNSLSEVFRNTAATHSGINIEYDNNKNFKPENQATKTSENCVSPHAEARPKQSSVIFSIDKKCTEARINIGRLSLPPPLVHAVPFVAQGKKSPHGTFKPLEPADKRKSKAGKKADNKGKVLRGRQPIGSSSYHTSDNFYENISRNSKGRKRRSESSEDYSCRPSSKKIPKRRSSSRVKTLTHSLNRRPKRQIFEDDDVFFEIDEPDDDDDLDFMTKKRGRPKGSKNKKDFGTGMATRRSSVSSSSRPPEKKKSSLSKLAAKKKLAAVKTLKKSAMKDQSKLANIIEKRRRPRSGDLTDSEKEKVKTSPSTSKRSPGKSSPRSASKTSGSPRRTSTASDRSIQFKPFPSINQKAEMVDIPIFYPTEQEFRDPISYIESIKSTAEPYGMCKIVPPPSWKPECRINEDMRFTAQVQYIHKLYKRWGPNVEKTACILKHLKHIGVEYDSIPKVGSVELDLARLSQTIHEHGGMQNVIDKKKWIKIADILQLPKNAVDRGTKIFDAYCKYLLPYDTLSTEEKKKLKQQVLADKQRKEQMEDDDEEEGIVKGKSNPLSTFIRVARNVQSMWYKEEPTAEQVEEEYWKIVEDGKQHVAVQCGHVNTRTQGTAFPAKRDNPYFRHSWNLNNLPQNSQSLLKVLGPITGTTIPTLHIGMLYATSCWSCNPHNLPYIQYLHSGADILWYSVPKQLEEKFKEAMIDLTPNLISDDPQWLKEDVVMVNPELLTENGVSVGRCIQRARQFIVIFDKSYTATVSCGYNVSESAHYATPEWLPLGMQATQILNESCERELFSMDALLYLLSTNQSLDKDTLSLTLGYLENVVTEEISLRRQLYDAGLKIFERMAVTDDVMMSAYPRKRAQDLLDADDNVCDISKKICYLSMVTNDVEKTTLCPKEALKYLHKKKSLKSWRLLYRYTDNELKTLVENTRKRLNDASGNTPGKKRSVKKI